MGLYPTPNATTSATLVHQISAYYRREALDQLTPIFVFYGLCEPDQIPQRNGKTIQWFRYTLLQPNVTPSSEGTVGTSLQMDTDIYTATLQEYDDFISMSSLLKATEIDNTATNYAKNLGIRAAHSVDTITRTGFDATTSTEGASISGSFSAADIRADVTKLKGLNVLPQDGGKFRTVIHPYMSYDLQADNSAGGWLESSKYAMPDQLLSGEIGSIGGSRVLETTNVKTSGTSPNVLYYSYTVGKGAMGAVDLAGSGPTKVRDPQKQMFNIFTVPGGPNGSDPTGKIGGYVSYLYRYVVKDLDSNVPRHRKTTADASLV